MLLQITKTDIAGMVEKLCDLCQADRGAAMAALQSAMSGHTDDINACINRAADILLQRQSAQPNSIRS